MYDNPHIYDSLPDLFVMTDPDLAFHPETPPDFIEQLVALAKQYQCYQVGLALDIQDFDLMFKERSKGRDIYECEKDYWKDRIPHPEYEMYKAPIDTTFTVVNKQGYDDYNIRVAGNMLAKHLPWYIDNKVYNVYENYMANLKTTDISTTSTRIIPFIESHYLRIRKRGELFLIKNTPADPNLSFWTDHFPGWEEETFDVFDRFLSPDKVFIDIGAWIGTTAMYASRKSKHVYAVEPDRSAFIDMSNHLHNNCSPNYTLLRYALYHVDETTVPFGSNPFDPHSRMNESTSQIQPESNKTFPIRTLTLSRLLRKYNILPPQISLIKVDIEGGEENVLPDLFDIHQTHGTPLYISFHYDWWKHKDLDRFEFLTEEQKRQIRENPFVSILF